MNAPQVGVSKQSTSAVHMHSAHPTALFCCRLQVVRLKQTTNAAKNQDPVAIDAHYCPFQDRINCEGFWPTGFVAGSSKSAKTQRGNYIAQLETIPSQYS